MHNRSPLKLFRSDILSVVVTAMIFSSVLSASAQNAPKQNKLEAPALYEKALPSVVVITALNSDSTLSLGSGVILRADGVLATNFHVISDAVAARVQLSNGDIYDDVSILDSDERRDLAILKIRAINLPVLDVTDSDRLKVGATIYTIGAPIGLSGSLSSGIVSSLRPANEISSKLTGFRVIQFTAPVSHGNSGGPLLDESCRLLGIVFYSRFEGQNINLAIPVNYVTPLVTNAKSDGRSLRRMPNLRFETETISGPKQGTINDIAGTYTGAWRSDQYGDAYGNVVLTISVVNGKVQAHVVLTGSPLFRQDTLNAQVSSMGAGVWKMDYKSKNGKISGTGIFRDGTFVGDYNFRRFLTTDSGKWELQK